MARDLIKRVRIGPFDYTVLALSEAEADQHEALGLHSGDELEILVLPNLPTQRRVEVLWHEIFHGMWLVAGLNEHVPAAMEEPIVNALGLQLVQVFRDNPALLRATMRALKDDA